MHHPVVNVRRGAIRLPWHRFAHVVYTGPQKWMCMAQAKPREIPGGLAKQMVEQLKTRRAPALEKLLLESGILQKDDTAGEIHEEAGIRYDSATYDQIWGDFCLCWQPPSEPYVVCSCWQHSWIGHCSHHYATEAWIAPTFCRPLLRLLRHNVLAKIKNQEKVLFWPRTIAE